MLDDPQKSYLSTGAKTTEATSSKSRSGGLSVAKQTPSGLGGAWLAKQTLLKSRQIYIDVVHIDGVHRRLLLMSNWSHGKIQFEDICVSGMDSLITVMVKMRSW